MTIQLERYEFVINQFRAQREKKGGRVYNNNKHIQNNNIDNLY